MAFPTGASPNPKSRLRLTTDAGLGALTAFPTPESADEPVEPTGQANPVRSARDRGDTYDALAELFLGGDPAKRTTINATEQRQATERTPVSNGVSAAAVPEIELLILGHLPVRAGAWVEQYARACAAQVHAPVALVRVFDDEASVDLCGTDSNGSANGAGGHTAFDEALGQAARLATHRILQVGEVDEPALALDPRVGRITLLCGTNDAAVVAAYRTIKSLAGELERQSLASATDHPRFAAAFVGATDAQAAEALVRLRRACDTFLRQPVEAGTSVSRVAPGSRTALFLGRVSGGARTAIDVLSSRSEPAAHRAVSTMERSNGTNPHQAIAPEQPDSVQRELRPSLSARIEGLSRLPIRWPDDERVEFARDAHGTVHVLALDDDGHGFEKAAAAAAWAARHRALIAQASGGHDFSEERRPIAHLLTDKPKSVRHLLDAEIRVHFFTRADAADGWICAELN